MCAPSDSPNTEGVCINVTDFREKVHYITTCPDGEKSYCPWEGALYQKPANCTKQPGSQPILPGEKCSADQDCYSKRCVSGTCQGLKEKATCAGNIECDVGLYCSN